MRTVNPIKRGRKHELCSQYQYSPLTKPFEQIRLLGMSSKSFGPRIYCELSTYCITNLPSYAALSYTWGPPEEVEIEEELPPQEKVYIDIDSRSLKINPNLFHALRNAVCARCKRNRTKIAMMDRCCVYIFRSNMHERPQKLEVVAQGRANHTLRSHQSTQPVSVANGLCG